MKNLGFYTCDRGERERDRFKRRGGSQNTGKTKIKEERKFGEDFSNRLNSSR